jgi:hypothetical protein
MNTRRPVPGQAWANSRRSQQRRAQRDRLIVRTENALEAMRRGAILHHSFQAGWLLNGRRWPSMPFAAGAASQIKLKPEGVHTHGR